MLKRIIGLNFISVLVLIVMVVSSYSLRAGTIDKGKYLKVALLPILDALPYYVAEGEGYFQEEGVFTKAIPVASGLSRDQLMQSGEIDAMLNEIATTASYNRNETNVKILSSARKPFSNYPMFRIISTPQSGLKNPLGLAGIPIAVSKNTIIEYVTDRLLYVQGLKPYQIKKLSVPSIPERYQLLIQGRIQAATLPDPMGLSALAAGAMEIISDAAYPHYSVSVLSFSIKSIKGKKNDIKHFLEAWHRAARAINNNPEKYRSLLLEKIRVPQNVQTEYPIPRFPVNEIPSLEEWNDVMDWMIDKKLLDTALPYHDSVSRDFLP